MKNNKLLKTDEEITAIVIAVIKDECSKTVSEYKRINSNIIAKLISRNYGSSVSGCKISHILSKLAILNHWKKDDSQTYISYTIPINETKKLK
jgi:hypothetical protein